MVYIQVKQKWSIAGCNIINFMITIITFRAGPLWLEISIFVNNFTFYFAFIHKVELSPSFV